MRICRTRMVPQARVSLALSLGALVGIAAASPAVASAAVVCVAIDTENDTLSPEDQKAARMMLAQTLRDQGAPVGTEGCTENWRVYHIKLGQAINVFLSGPDGSQQAQAARIEELPQTYDQLVRGLISGQKVDSTNQTTTRHNVTNPQASPRRVEADTVKYIRLGFGGVLGPSTLTGPAIGAGYRYELDQLGIDVSLGLLLDTDDNNNNDDLGANIALKLMALWFMDPVANGSLYFGAGAGWGGTSVAHRGALYSDSGLQGELSAGYEFLRASTIRMFVQADASLPFYRIDTGILGANGLTIQDETWAPTFTVSLGVGWGRGLSRIQVLQ